MIRAGKLQPPTIQGWGSEHARREAVVHLEQSYEMSERRACSLIGADRSSVRYRHRRPDDRELREVLRGAAETHRRFGYRRLHVILRRDGHVLNRKRTQRLYTARRACRFAADEAASGPLEQGRRW